jgi:DNA-binding CsgD family transcriptional regulator
VDTTASPEVLASSAASLGLTRREVEVLALVAEGRTNRQIGQALSITPNTASSHVSRILAKLGVAGRGEAAAIAHRLGLDSDDPRRPWPLLLGAAANATGQTATSSTTSRWQPTQASRGSGYSLLTWPRRRQHAK